jgi:hypothetical protein
LANLADRADDSTLTCFPSIGRIAADTRLSERAVQKALARLEGEGLVRRELREQSSTIYRLCVLGDAEDESHAPLPEPHSPGGAPHSPGRCTTFTTSGEPRAPITLNGNPQLTLNEGERSCASRGSRLPDGWQPSAAHREYAIECGLDPERVGADFCDYWKARAGEKARKLDWSATWRSWCRREQDRRQPQRVPSRRPNAADHLRAAAVDLDAAFERPPRQPASDIDGELG